MSLPSVLTKARYLTSGRLVRYAAGPLTITPDDIECFTIPSRGSIKIVKVPEGEAPLAIREKWIGIQIPTVCFESRSADDHGVISHQLVPEEPRYVVLQTEAVTALEKNDVATATWWKNHGFPVAGDCFCFKADEVVEIEPVSPRSYKTILGLVPIALVYPGLF